ncbi:MAG: PEP-CTERM sorting domain-containing protein [Verrucomicrobiota bacterium]
MNKVLLGQRDRFAVALIVTLGFLGARCWGQGTFTPITFDGPPPQPWGTRYTVQNYSEAGMSFTPIDPNAPWAGFSRNGGGISGCPDNGTAYLQAYVGSTLLFESLDGLPFDLMSADLAGYSTVVPDTVFNFVGYRQGGTTVTADFTMTGIDFQTYYFGAGFSDLVRVEIPNDYWGSLDNLTIQRSVPEPATGALMCVGALLVGLRLLRPNKSLHSTPR